MKPEQKFTNREAAPTGALGMCSRPTDIGQEKHMATERRRQVASPDKICHQSSNIRLAQTSPSSDGGGMILGFKVSEKCAAGPVAARSGKFCGRKVALVKTLEMHSPRTDISSLHIRQGVCTNVTLRTHVRRNTIASSICANGH